MSPRVTSVDVTRLPYRGNWRRREKEKMPTKELGRKAIEIT
jgi:hypothetical protein